MSIKKNLDELKKNAYELSAEAKTSEEIAVIGDISLLIEEAVAIFKKRVKENDNEM